MNGFSFGLRGHDIADDFDSMCALAAQNKIKILQFALAKTVSDIDFDSVGYDEEISARLKKSFDDYGLFPSVLGCYINPIDSDLNSREIQAKRFLNFIKYARDFGSDVIGTETGWTDDIKITRSKENYADFMKTMYPLVCEAEREGVNIGIEPVCIGTIYSADMMKKMIDDMQSDRLSVIMDFSNITDTYEAYKKQDDTVKHAFDILNDRIKVIHLKDYKFDGGKKSFAPPGEGMLNIRLIFECAKKLSVMPKIILDELPVSLYAESCERIKNLLQ